MDQIARSLFTARLWIGRYFGINVYLHWTLLIFIGAFLLKSPLIALFMLAAFLSVLLHEFGHALTAKIFGFRVGDINMFPIGGVASVETPTDQPLKEFLIIAAGPMVNFILALVLIPISGGVGVVGYINLLIGLFNLLPMFPMDGGRILRAFLSSISGNPVWSTWVAVRLGQVLAAGFAVLGIWLGHLFWPVMAGLLMVGGEIELSAIRGNGITKQDKELG